MSKNKRITDKFIKWALSKLNQWTQYRIKKYGTSLIDNPNNYESLLPNAKSDEKGYYSDSLKIALDTPRVNNIAITGPYGSGKSSFIETFKEQNLQWNYLPVSLATFKNKKDDEFKEVKLSDIM
jgi:predicted NACHT family NTPase